MKERLTITLDSSLLSAVDTTIDGVNIRNRSHAIENLLNSAIGFGKPKKAVVFAGGSTVTIEGRQMPVPLLPINGKPIIEYILDELKRNRMLEIVIVAGKEHRDAFKNIGNGFTRGLNISYVEEDKQKGTEGALELAKREIGNAPFFALNGDHIFSIDLGDMYTQHLANKALATVALIPAASSSRFGVTSLEGNRIKSFVQKHEMGKTAALVNAGIYLFNPEVFGFIGNVQHRTMLEEDLFPKLAESGKLFGYVFPGPWSSLDSTANISRSIRELEAAAAQRT
jgi:NDP-sugar pyrophosphorylase family protein